MGDQGTIVVTLAGALVAMAGVIVWAVRFTLRFIGSRFLGKDGAWANLMKKFDSLADGLAKNTERLGALRDDQKQLLLTLSSLQKEATQQTEQMRESHCLLKTVCNHLNGGKAEEGR